VKRFRGGLVSKAQRLLYQSTLGLRVIEKKKRVTGRMRSRIRRGRSSHSTKGPSRVTSGAVLEPLVQSWSHCVGIYRQKLTKSSKIDFCLRFGIRGAKGLGVTGRMRSRIRRIRSSHSPPVRGGGVFKARRLLYHSNLGRE